MLSVFSIVTPALTDLFKGIYEQIRGIKIGFKERFELDHIFDGSLDPEHIECDGYHKQVTMEDFNATQLQTRPDFLSGSARFFSIGGELCCINEKYK